MMSEVKLQPGDVVRLKSGGPLMTVARFEGELVLCTWFVNGTLAHSKFLPLMLEKDDGPTV